ncbi:SDR family oxidoreductase [Arthrobacter sp. AK01]|uniref:SDR family NAD(P)-dependent oxidoreductase n=1 Tax=Micrococcaceae TaxID=1268 RepID=UPI001E531FC0|nr:MULTISPECIES: SDR family oxidoreductase [Micrococcaceae]MCD4853425.1 SDR family oxidoreductase [Arthrobacter sp. AK01]MCP1413771.1 dihydroanticapsin dehydrogenase [Paenarthrobacter sp. A20]
MKGLNGRRVLITGAAGGIGAAVAQRLAAEGAIVAGADLVKPELNKTLAFAGAMDVCNASDTARLVSEVNETLGGIDAVVAVAGIQASGPTHELSEDVFRKVLDVNVLGTFLTTRAVIPQMLEQGYGTILTFGSTAAVCGAPELAAYAAAKGAILQYTRSIAVEYASRGIRANCICPGGTMTPLLRQLNAERSEPDHFAAKHPIGRYAEPDEIAAAATFLLSDDASFVLGSAMLVDGGFSAS